MNKGLKIIIIIAIVVICTVLTYFGGKKIYESIKYD